LFAHQFCSLFGDFLLYYCLVLVQARTDLVVCDLATLDLQLAVILQLVDLSQQHLLGGFLLIVNGATLQSLRDLLRDLFVLTLASTSNAGSHLLKVVLHLANRLQRFNIRLHLALVCLLKLNPSHQVKVSIYLPLHCDLF